ncbi:MAG TPA: hypothetical protein PLF13_02015 [candidate division Zixibacteria bacterium]|nr:hypothetical protein [candidate division Zixibacteria bacterium]
MQQPITIRDTEIKVTDILAMIAKGYSYYQILLHDSRLTLSDIMVTAKLANELIEQFVTPEQQLNVEGEIRIRASGGRIVNLSEMRKEYPRAFAEWSKAEESQLVELYRSGRSLQEIARALQRKRGAIRTRLQKLGVLETDDKD